MTDHATTATLKADLAAVMRDAEALIKASVPALIVLSCGTLLFLPLTHVLTFSPGRGWIEDAPGLGLGAVGGWTALLVYVLAIALALWLRWRHGAWRRIRL